MTRSIVEDWQPLEGWSPKGNAHNWRRSGDHRSRRPTGRVKYDNNRVQEIGSGTDLTKEPSFLKLPFEFNSYTGEYVYEIMGDKLSGKIKGIIPEPEDTRKIKE